jgi:predicted RNA-binding Zn-ribbon protein involved in translation (DUF1610 family)
MGYPLTKTLSSGRFVCPACGKEAGYKLKSEQPYFRILFIPLYPSGPAYRYAVCDSCGGELPETDLLKAIRGGQQDIDATQPAPPPSREQVLAKVQRDLLDGVSFGRCVGELTHQGFEEDKAEAAVLEMCGQEPRRCVCGRRYHPKALRCEDCGSPL